MVNNIVGLIREPVKEALKNGKEFSLLAKKKNGSGYYQIKEYIGFLKSSEINEQRPEMQTLTLIFENGKEVKTVAYTDGIIEPDTLVSIYGYMYKFNETLQLACCLGIEKVFDTIPDIIPYAEKIDLGKTHIIKGVLNLSEAKESKEYSENEKIKRFKDTKFFYIEEEPKNIIPILGKISYDVVEKAISISSNLNKNKSNDDDFDFDCSDVILNQPIELEEKNLNNE